MILGDNGIRSPLKPAISLLSQLPKLASLSLDSNDFYGKVLVLASSTVHATACVARVSDSPCSGMHQPCVRGMSLPWLACEH